MPVLFIDAHSGDVVFRYDNLQTASGSGDSLYSGTVSDFDTYYASRNLTTSKTPVRKVGTFNSNNGYRNTYRFEDADDNLGQLISTGSG